MVLIWIVKDRVNSGYMQEMKNFHRYILYLSHFFDFGASFADQGSTLAGWDNKPQGYRGFTGCWTVAHGIDYILRGRKDQVLSNECCALYSMFVEVHLHACVLHHWTLQNG